VVVVTKDVLVVGNVDVVLVKVVVVNKNVTVEITVVVGIGRLSSIARPTDKPMTAAISIVIMVHTAMYFRRLNCGLKNCKGTSVSRYSGLPWPAGGKFGKRMSS